MIRRVSVRGDDQQLASLYYWAYRQECARHADRIGCIAVYHCPATSRAKWLQFAELVDRLGLDIICMSLQTETGRQAAWAGEYDRLCTRFGAEWFSPADVRTVLGIDVAPQSKLMAQMVRAGMVERAGYTTQCRYRVVGVEAA